MVDPHGWSNSNEDLTNDENQINDNSQVNESDLIKILNLEWTKNMNFAVKSFNKSKVISELLEISTAWYRQIMEMKALAHDFNQDEPCNLVNHLVKYININTNSDETTKETNTFKIRNYIIKLTVDLEILNDERRSKIITWSTKKTTSTHWTQLQISN